MAVCGASAWTLSGARHFIRSRLRCGCSGLWGDKHIRTGDGFLCVYSITSRASFDEVPKFCEHILQAKDVKSV